jgi:hypothetical protein
MNTMLQQRIQNLMGDAPMPPMGMQAGGEVDAMPQTMAPNPDAELASAAINEFMMAADTAESPEEANIAKAMAEKTATAAQAPMADMAAELAAQGRGGDSVLAHLTPGEVVLPAEMFDDPQFEATVESRFNELDLDPERYVVGMGIASLNANTGLEEFFLKKVGKFFKKVVKKVAPYAGIIAAPFTGGASAALIGGLGGLASGKGLKGALAGAAGGFGASKLLSGIGSLAGAGAGTGTAGTGGTFLSRVGEFIMPGQDKVGLFGNIGKGIGSLFGGAGQSPEEAAKVLMAQAEGNPALTEQITGLVAQGYGPDEILQMVGGSQGSNPLMQAVNYVIGQSGPSFGSDPYTQSLLDREQQARTGRNPLLAFLDDKLGLDLSGKGLLGSIKNIGGGEGGGIGLGGAGIAALLGKLAFDEAKNRKGVPLTPLTQMDAAGRYNIEAEIARRMGKEKPSPEEFGLLPAGILPQLSGGRPTPKPEMERKTAVEPFGGQTAEELGMFRPRLMMNGGMVAPMRYAEGGDVATEDFERMNGDIAGPGTETSDDVPAMLSDGEFVMTGRAVRGAGAFDMSKDDGGIITLTPNKNEDRDRGTALMYDMMDLFSEFAGART